jgi:outer membrane protein OmpA-like peptidoglycan-associated protein/curli biogenesis system outer membrane secretion channel CsgG
MKSTFSKALAILPMAFIILAVAAVDGITDKVTYQGNKARITVGTIKSKADDCDYEMAAAIGEMLSTALANCEKFIVLASQEEVGELIDEIELGESEYVEEGRGADKGLMEGADVLITGAVTGFEPEASGGGGALGGLKKKAFGKVGLESKTATILIDLKLIDIRTRRVIKAMSLEGKSSSWAADVAGGGFVEDVALGGAMGVFSNQPMEKAVREVLAKAVEKISKDIPDEYYRYKGKGEYSKEYGASSKEPASGQGGGGSASGGSSAGAVRAQDMKLYTKYDFIPGDKVIFYDDLSGEEQGEFPSKWSLVEGVFEVASKGGKNVILCSNKGSIGPKMKTALPPNFTVELEIYSNGADIHGNDYYIYILGKDDEKIGQFCLADLSSASVSVFDRELSSKSFEDRLGKGFHTMRIMATKTTMKCFIDHERVANIPEIEYFEPRNLQIYCDTWEEQGNPQLLGSLCVAEGGKSMREQLDETGKIITHGILFDHDSDVIKAESYRTLTEIGKLMADDQSLRLSIEGHTDSDGETAYNQDLSDRRSSSVKAYLIDRFQIDDSRLQTKGFGEDKPIDANTTSEGKANNRRVELVKL